MKTIVITGASTGIGHASAIHLSRTGFLVFAGVRKPSDAERLTKEGGDRIVPVAIDVTDDASIRAALQTVRARLDGRGLDGLVNNAGLGIAGPIEHVTREVLWHQFEVNVFGQIAVTQAFLPLIRQARGRIVNMGSVGSHISMPFGGVLCATKSAFRSLNDALRLELHPFGIHVSMIEPAAIHTPATEKMLGDVDAVIDALPPEGKARYADMLREFIRRAYEREQAGSPPEVVAEAVLHALTAEHPRARYPVGKHSRLLVNMPRFLPDGLLDRIRYRLFGLPPGSAPRSSSPG
jgi:NAD(P)-dependent dehydrogenase (short-subunit alcohol dehydrogenase family)